MDIKKLENGAIKVAHDLKIPVVEGLLEMIQALHTNSKVEFTKQELFEKLLTDEEFINNLDQKTKNFCRAIFNK